MFMLQMGRGGALELIERERVTNFSGVPVDDAARCWPIPTSDDRDTSSLAAWRRRRPVQPDLVDKIDKSLPGRYARRAGYGMTET